MISNEVQYIWNVQEYLFVVKKTAKSTYFQSLNGRTSQQNFRKIMRMTAKFQDELDCLLDIAEKPKGRYTEEKGIEYLRSVMRQQGKQKRTGFACNDR